MKTKKRVLAVDDRPNSLKVLAAILSDEGYEVLQARNGSQALETYARQEDIDVVLSDLKMPGMDGLELFRQMNGIRQAPPFVMMTAYGTVKSAVEALKQGVTNYLIKPLDYEELTIVLEKAIRERELTRELVDLKRQVFDGRPFHGIIAEDDKMQDIFEMVRTVGRTDASVLIYGETGTGKELLAKALHRESQRKKREMVCINSVALTESLLEAELFGYVRGAFTGADSDRKGRLETADGGTLFLDEIGHMSQKLQAKLLRFLQEKTFEPVGGTLARKVDVRVIAATNIDLRKEIASGRFLGDLLYRIEVISIRVPPLRNRGDDIYLLTHHFIRRYAAQYEKTVKGIDPDAMAAMAGYGWPGNVRELKNYLARAVILSKGPQIVPADLPEVVSSGQGAPGQPRGAGSILNQLPATGYKLKEMERDLIRLTLERCGGNKSLAAKQLGISRKTLYEKLARYV